MKEKVDKIESSCFHVTKEPSEFFDTTVDTLQIVIN